MDQGVWTFARGVDKLEITRQILDDGTVLQIAGDGSPRSYFFRDVSRLEIFQKDMETLLLKTGWTFVAFEPDQRTGRERRGWPRRSNDRRRWWTDGKPKTTVAQSEPVNALRGRDERPRSSGK